jgi:hypothetical protein
MNTAIAIEQVYALPDTGNELAHRLEMSFGALYKQYERKGCGSISSGKLTTEHLQNVCKYCYPEHPECLRILDNLANVKVLRLNTDDMTKTVSDKISDIEVKYRLEIQTFKDKITDIEKKHQTEIKTLQDKLLDTDLTNETTVKTLQDKISDMQKKHEKEMSDAEKGFSGKIDDKNKQIEELKAEVKEFRQSTSNFSDKISDKISSQYQTFDTRILDMDTAHKAEIQTYLNKISDIEAANKIDIKELNDKILDIVSTNQKDISDIENRHKSEMLTKDEAIFEAEKRHEQEKKTMSDALENVQFIVQKLSKKSSIFQREWVILTCFIGVVAYQSYETSLGLEKFHAISGKTVPYLVALACAALVGLFGIILTMNMPKKGSEYDLKPLQNYEIAVFLFNAYLFVPDVWVSEITHFYDVLATLVYCAIFPFIEFTFGKVYLSKKQDREKLENEVLKQKIN